MAFFLTDDESGQKAPKNPSLAWIITPLIIGLAGLWFAWVHGIPGDIYTTGVWAADAQFVRPIQEGVVSFDRIPLWDGERWPALPADALSISMIIFTLNIGLGLALAQKGVYGTLYQDKGKPRQLKSIITLVAVILRDGLTPSRRNSRLEVNSSKVMVWCFYIAVMSIDTLTDISARSTAFLSWRPIIISIVVYSLGSEWLLFASVQFILQTISRLRYLSLAMFGITQSLAGAPDGKQEPRQKPGHSRPRPRPQPVGNNRPRRPR